MVGLVEGIFFCSRAPIKVDQLDIAMDFAQNHVNITGWTIKHGHKKTPNILQ